VNVDQPVVAKRAIHFPGPRTQVALAQANQTYVFGAAAKVQAEVTLLFQKVLLEYALGTLQPELIKP